MKVVRRYLSTALIGVLISASLSFASEIPDRKDISDESKWKLEDTYSSDQVFYQDMEKLASMLEDFKSYEGKLSDSNMLKKALMDRDDMSMLAERLYVYANLKKDVDANDATASEIADKIDSLSNQIGESLSFFTPEILSQDESLIRSYINDPELSDYDFYFKELLRNKSRSLSKEEERILALASDIASSPESIYEEFRYKDRKIRTVRNESGEEVKIGSNYSTLLDSKDRDIRKAAFEGEFSSFEDSINTIAAILSTEVKSNIFYSKARGYDSALEASLDADNIRPEVYESFVSTVNENLAPLHRYVSLRKRVLGVDNVRYYDMYVPIVENPGGEIEYEDAKKMVAEALAPLGDQYVKDLNAGFEGGWIDVYENKGKYGGAYSWGSYSGPHPYVLLNYNKSLNSVSTLAHEMGHALNSYYSNKSQPYSKADYTIFTAEVASTTNEAMMLDYMIANAKTKEEKMYLINTYLEQIRGSIYTQIMYAEFEKTIHERVESGDLLDANALNSIWKDLMVKYYGPDFEADQMASMWWSRIPHFYSNFYVYKYATGLSSGIIISENIMSDKEGAKEAYLEFLAAGGSDYPIALLKETGVDLSTPAPIEKSLQKFDALLKELESLMSEQ